MTAQQVLEKAVVIANLTAGHPEMSERWPNQVLTALVELENIIVEVEEE